MKNKMSNIVKKDHFLHGFPCVYNENSRILILGSFPSVKSRLSNFYYMHPQNRFWKILSNLFDIDFINLDILQKTQALLDLHIALYDVITSCDIIGSSDASISNPTYIDMKMFPNIKKIYLNGQKAYDLFIKKYPELQNISYKLPSTSPANAKFSLQDLIEEWKVIKKGIKE